MFINLTKFYNKTYLINLLFSFIPISFIAGNLILNLNILLLIITTIAVYKTEIIRIKIFFLDKIIIIFFAYAFCVGLFNNLYSYYFDSSSNDLGILVKTFFYMRYLVFYFIIRFLVDRDLINFKLFFLFCASSSLFVCFDLIYQFNFGKDILGFAATPRRMSGPFGDELIAGGYLQRFSIFSFFLFPFFYKIKNKRSIYLIVFILSTLTIFGLIVAGNRMPFILFLLMILLIFLFEEKIRKFIIIYLVCAISIFLIAYNLNTNIKKHFGIFKTKIVKIINVFSESNVVSEKDFENIYLDNVKMDMNNYVIKIGDKQFFMNSTHIKEFYSGYRTWLQNKFTGGGIKSFKYNCPKTFKNCGSHPHNYYLEIFADLGLIGFIFLNFIFGAVIYISFIKKYFLNSNFSENKLMIPFIFLFIVEVFPLKTTGSFFTTGNATFIFLILSITVALSRKENLIEK